jgi:hypothetical protein
MCNLSLVRATIVLAPRPGVTVVVAVCENDHARRSPVENESEYRLVLVRRGCFHRRVAGAAVDLDRTQSYPMVLGSFVYVGAWLDLAHRRLLAATRTGDVEYGLIEELLELLRIIHQFVLDGTATARDVAERRFVAQAREAIVSGDPVANGLVTDLRFADRAHLCQTVRAHVGYSPSVVRRLLGGDRAGA